MVILVMVIVKCGIWLPRLPPASFELNARVVYDAVVVYVEKQHVKRH
jgi:hypothetical protein